MTDRPTNRWRAHREVTLPKIIAITTIQAWDCTQLTIFLELSNALKELGDGGGDVGQLNDVALGGLVKKNNKNHLAKYRYVNVLEYA